MKCIELFEMPTYLDLELPISDVEVNVMSLDTIQREYDVISHSTTDFNKIKTLLDVKTKKKSQASDKPKNVIIGAIKKDNSSAVVGPLTIRNDGTPAVAVSLTISFHDPEDNEPENAPGEAGINALQVDTVVAANQLKGAGYGYALYKMLMNAQKTILSDNIQYIGGKKLWEKIVKKAAQDGHQVYVLQNGKYLRDAQGLPIVYNGTNIPDSEIWSTNKRSLIHYYTRLAAKNKPVEPLNETYVALLKNGTSVYVNPGSSEMAKLIKEARHDGQLAFRFTAIPRAGSGDLYLWPYWSTHYDTIAQLKAQGKFPDIEYDDFTSSLTGVAEWRNGSLEFSRSDVLESLEYSLINPNEIDDAKFKKRVKLFLKNLDKIQNSFNWLSNWFDNYDSANPYEELKMKISMGGI